MSPNEETGTGSLRLWKKSLQSEDPEGWRGRPDTRRRGHAAPGTDGRHPPAGRPPSRALRPTSLTLAGRSGSLRGQRDREWRDAGPRRQQIQLVNRDSGEEATNTQGRLTASVSDARSPTGCPLTTAASLRQHVEKDPPTSVRSAPTRGGRSQSFRTGSPRKRDAREKRKNNGKAGGKGMRRPPQSYFFGKGEI